MDKKPRIFTMSFASVYPLYVGFKATQARALVDRALVAVTPTSAALLLQAALRAS